MQNEKTKTKRSKPIHKEDVCVKESIGDAGCNNVRCYVITARDCFPESIRKLLLFVELSRTTDDESQKQENVF